MYSPKSNTQVPTGPLAFSSVPPRIVGRVRRFFFRELSSSPSPAPETPGVRAFQARRYWKSNVCGAVAAGIGATGLFIIIGGILAWRKPTLGRAAMGCRVDFICDCSRLGSAGRKPGGCIPLRRRDRGGQRFPLLCSLQAVLHTNPGRKAREVVLALGGLGRQTQAATWPSARFCHSRRMGSAGA